MSVHALDVEWLFVRVCSTVSRAVPKARLHCDTLSSAQLRSRRAVCRPPHVFSKVEHLHGLIRVAQTTAKQVGVYKGQLWTTATCSRSVVMCAPERRGSCRLGPRLDQRPNGLDDKRVHRLLELLDRLGELHRRSAQISSCSTPGPTDATPRTPPEMNSHPAPS